MDKKFLAEQYINQGKSMADIARENHCSRQTVYRLIKKYGIPPRNRSESRIKALEKEKFKDKKKRHINETFFEPSNWSPGMAWVLGLLFADGNMEKSNPVFRLSQRTPDGLWKVLNLMRSSHTIAIKEKKSYKGVISGKIYNFKVWNKKIYNDLLNLGLKPAKSTDMKFPRIPPEYMNHFIRGLYDGDGSFYINRFDGTIISQYRNGSLDFITTVTAILQKELNIPITIHRNEKFNTYYIKISQKIKELVNYLYMNAHEAIYLTEKYNNIKNLIG
ncbi:MAG: helix-turn-helix domain-containing protein [Candidatus Aminicenantes bacterium]|nr:MAG: helix-turn-helix domain-containing protein [Candidatus Aminicenantes bacterium]